MIQLHESLLVWGQSGERTAQAAWDVLVAVGAIAALAVVVVAVALIVRRRVVGDDEPTISTGFTLADMRRMHAEGELSDEEFERAKAALLARGRASLAPSADDSSAGSSAEVDETDEAPAGEHGSDDEGRSDAGPAEPDRPS